VTWPIYGLAAPIQYYLCATPPSNTSINNGDDALEDSDMRSGYARVSAEGRLRIRIDMVCSFSYVSSSISGVSIEDSVGYSFD
jgi:hypothetical protein